MTDLKIARKNNFNFILFTVERYNFNFSLNYSEYFNLEWPYYFLKILIPVNK